MKLNEREVKLLSMLAAVLIIACGYFFLIQGEFDKVSKLAADLKTYTDKIKLNESDLQQQNTYQSRLSKLESDTESASKLYFPIISFANLSYDLNTMLNETGATLRSAVFADPVLKAVIKDKAKASVSSPVDATVKSYNALQGDTSVIPTLAPATAAPTAAPATGTDTGVEAAAGTAAANGNLVYFTQASIKCNGSYTQVYNFISKLKSGSRKIVITQVTMTLNADKSVDATIEATFYALPKLAGQDEDYVKWSINGAKGANDPFAGS